MSSAARFLLSSTVRPSSPGACAFCGSCLRCTWIVACLILGGILSPAGAQHPLPLVAPQPGSSSTQAATDTQEDTPQKLLALLGIEASHLHGFQDGVPLSQGEEEFLTRFLYSVGRFQWSDFLQWKRPLAESYQDLLAHPARRRGDVFSLQGRLLHVQRHAVIPELAQRIGIPHYYLCRIRLEPSRHQATIVLREVPPGWEKKPPQGDRVAAEALFVKLEGAPPDPRPVFVAQHLAWFPDTFLGRLGVDAAALSRSRPRGPFVAQDRHPFYQLLRAAGKLSWRELQAQLTPGEKIAEQNPRFAKYRNQPPGLQAPAFWILTLVERPESFRGTVLSVEGTARRAVRIEVTDPEIRARYGVKQYWEVEIFVDPGPRIQLFGETVAYYPVVACVNRLPPGFPEGENLHETVALEGVFFKVWSYYSALGMKQRPQQVLQRADQNRDGRIALAELARYLKLSPQDPHLQERFDRADRNRSRFLEREELQWLLGLQNAPLLVAPSLRWTPQQPAGNSTAGVIGGVLVLLALVVLGVVLWKTHRRDDELARTVRRRLLEEKPEFPKPEEPSFSAPADETPESGTEGQVPP